MEKLFSIDEKYLKISKEQIGSVFSDEIKEKVIYIYGKNGSGKTSLSRKLYESKNLKDSEYTLFLFNEDYIQRNVFQYDFKDEKNMTKRGLDNNKNSFEIFFGEKLKKIENEINITNEDIEKNLEKANILLQIDNIDINYKNNFCEQILLNEQKIKKNLLDKLGLLENDQKLLLIEQMNLFKNNESFNIIIKRKIDIYDLVKKLNEKILALNLILGTKSKDKFVYDLHKYALDFKIPQIEWMNKIFKREDIENWFIKISKEKHIFRQNIESLISKIRKEINYIFNDSAFDNLIKTNQYKTFRVDLDCFLDEAKNYDVTTEIYRENNTFSFDWTPPILINEVEVKNQLISLIDKNRYKIIKTL